MRICKYDKKIWLDSAVGISQYEINMNKTKKLITIIGELHDLDFICQAKDVNISLFEYCESRIAENTKCKILLEYPPDCEDPTRLGSKIIRDTFNGNTTVRKATTGIDIRYDFIGMNNISILYHDNTRIPETFEKINNDFIKPFSLERLDKICGKPNNEIAINYCKILSEKFSNLSDIHNKNNNEFILELKWAWSMVMDYHIINKITKDTNTNEFVIIVGKNHLTNLRTLLNNAKDCKVIVDISNKNKSNCVGSHDFRKVCM